MLRIKDKETPQGYEVKRNYHNWLSWKSWINFNQRQSAWNYCIEGESILIISSKIDSGKMMKNIEFYQIRNQFCVFDTIDVHRIISTRLLDDWQEDGGGGGPLEQRDVAIQMIQMPTVR